MKTAGQGVSAINHLDFERLGSEGAIFIPVQLSHLEDVQGALDAAFDRKELKLFKDILQEYL